MEFKRLKWFERFIINSHKEYKTLNTIIAVILILMIYVLVYVTGGAKNIFTISMYFVIIFIGITLGGRAGMFYGLIGGILIGPLMPFDTISNKSQDLTNSIYRMIILVLIGGLIGYVTEILRSNLKLLKTQFTSNIETNVPNIYSLSDVKLNPNSHVSATIISVLINNHEFIIDIFGRKIYLEVIKSVYERLSNHCVNNSLIIQSDTNKFWISRPNPNNDFDIEYLLNILREPVVINGVPLYVNFSVGIDTIDDCDAILSVDTYSYADIAARQAHITHREYLFFSEQFLMNRFNLELIGMLSHAIKSDEICMVFQPVIDMKTDKPAGFEALIRWDHPQLGRIMPDKFIPYIEETPLSHMITYTVVEKTLIKMQEFKEKGYEVLVSVNISPRNLQHPKFLSTLVKLVDKYGIKPTQLILEITESSLINRENETILKTIKEQGFLIALDDFGTGYSSLSYLGDYEFDFIKIDRHFTKRMITNPAIINVIKTIVDLSHSLSAKVVIEGIEDDTLSKLASALCDYGQGYYYARPLENIDTIPWYEAQMLK